MAQHSSSFSQIRQYYLSLSNLTLLLYSHELANFYLILDELVNYLLNFHANDDDKMNHMKQIMIIIFYLVLFHLCRHFYQKFFIECAISRFFSIFAGLILVVDCFVPFIYFCDLILSLLHFLQLLLFYVRFRFICMVENSIKLLGEGCSILDSASIGQLIVTIMHNPNSIMISFYS